MQTSLMHRDSVYSIYTEGIRKCLFGSIAHIKYVLKPLNPSVNPPLSRLKLNHKLRLFYLLTSHVTDFNELIFFQDTGNQLASF